MYRIMLVDDEPLIMAGIASMVDWEAHDCKIVGKATNGAKALEAMEESDPDIVITDIKMPTMNGIEFIRRARQKGSDASFILLTNLEEFGLAQQAMGLGVIDYLVKLNLSSDILEQSLMRAISQCKQRVKQNAGHKFADSRQTLDESTKRFFQNILLDSENLEQLKKEAEALDIEKRFPNPMLILMNMNYPVDNFSEEFTNKDQKNVMTFAENILNEMIKRYFDTECLLKWEQNSFMLIVSVDKQRMLRKIVSNMGEKIRTVLKDYFEVSISIAVSEVGDSIYKLPDLIYQVVQGMNAYYYNDTKYIVFYDQSCEKKSERSSNFHIGFLKKDLEDAIRQNDQETFNSIIEQIIGLFAEHKPDKVQAVNACVNLYYYISSFYEEDSSVDEEIFPFAINIIGHLNHLGSLQDIIDWLKQFAIRVTNFLESKKSTKSDKIIELVRAYVQECYSEKLSLGIVAEHLGISQGYLSSVFKKQTGCNFSDYVSKVRIEKGKELICTHEYMMYEISDMLGFENPYYFSKVFKKVTGMTPKEYEVSVYHG